MAITHLLVSNHSYRRRIFVYLDSDTGFIKTLLLALPFHGDTKLSTRLPT